MVRFRGRRLQAAARLDPPWLGLRRRSGRNPLCAMSPSGRSAQKAASFRPPPSSARSPAPPISSSLAPSPISGAMLRPSPSTCVPLPSPLERPALSRVGTARSFRAPPALRSSSGAAVILPAPGACSPLPSPPVSSAFGQVCTARRLRPPPPLSPWIGCPPYTGVTPAAPGACVPPSPQASPAQGVLLVPSSLERPARNPVGMAKHLLPAPALRSSTSAAFILPALGAGLRLPSPPRSSAVCQLGTARCLRPPPPLPSPSKGWPPYTDITLAAAGSCVPPSPRASPLPGAMLPPATEYVDEELWYASKDKESVEQMIKKMRLTATDSDMLVDYDETDQGKPPWRGAGLSQLAYLQQPSPMEPTECLQLQYAISAEWSGSKHRESVEEMLRKMKLSAAAEADTLVDDDEDQGKQSWVCAGLSQLAYLQQPSPMEPAECLQLSRHRPVIGQRFHTNLLQFKSRLVSPRLLSRRLFTRSFATESSSPPDKNKKIKKIVKFSPLSPHLAPASVQSHKIGVYTKLNKFKDGMVKPDHIRDTIANDIKVVKDQFNIDYLMRLYDEKVEDILVANGIFVDPSDATYLAALDAGLLSAWEHVFEQKGPLYLTTLDVMRTNVALSPLKWRYFLDYLRDRKIIVIKRWDLSLGRVETMMYSHAFNYGIGGKKFYRGQTHASFKYQLGTAALCGITWKNIQVFDCLICPEIACKSGVEAGLLSAYMVLRRALDLKIEDYLLYTHCSHVDGVLREETVVKENEQLSKILVGLKARFRNIFCQLEPREKLIFPDCLLKLERASVLVFEDILRIWSPHLLGLPIFRIHQKRHEIVKDFISKQASGGRLVLHHAYKVKVKDESSKLDALRDVVKGILPKSVEVLVRNKKEALVVKHELKKLFIKGTLVEFEKCKENLGKGYEVAVMKENSVSARERTLRVIFHSSMEDVMVRRIDNTISVKLVTPNDSDDCIETLRPECFLFFNGKPGALLDIEKKS